MNKGTFISNEELLAILRESQLIPEENLIKLSQSSKDKNLSLYQTLIDSDLIDDEQLGQVVADYLKIPFVNLSKISIADNILNIVPELVAKKQKVIAFDRDAKGLKLAMADPNNEEIQQFIAKKVEEKVIPYLATDRDIDGALVLYQKELQNTFDEMLKEAVDNNAQNAQSSEAPISKIVDLLIEYAYQNKASDIHIEPDEKRSLVRFRIDGVLHDVLTVPPALHDQIVTRIKVLSKLRTDEHLSAQDGKMQAKLEAEDLDIRVSIVPIIENEKVVMRLLSSRSRKFSLEDLGMSEKDLEKVTNAFNKPYGMVLSTGPTGSGKTTSIYAIVKILNTREKNIATIEDPVEYDIEGINQIQVNPKTNLTFADGLRAILRQDPDIIFVGEIRDAETAGIAVNSAMTGHLVLSTLHTNNAATALPRLTDMEVEPFLIASTVNVIIGQRLVRKICEKCRISETTTLAELEKHLPKEIIKKLFDGKKEVRTYKGKGCLVCHSTGYVGRIGIFEVLEVSEVIRELIIAKADADEITKKAISEGMSTMLEDGLKKVLNGITTVEEILRATKA